MLLKELITQGWLALNRNRLRTLLTMLGIIIGVAAVLTMVGLGGGARAAVQNNVKSAGTNVRPHVYSIALELGAEIRLNRPLDRITSLLDDLLDTHEKTIDSLSPNRFISGASLQKSSSAVCSASSFTENSASTVLS